MSIQLLLLLVLGILFIISYIKDKNKLNPLTLFYGEWFIIILLSRMQLYNLNGADNETYYIILVGCCVFAIGYYLICTSNNKLDFLFNKFEFFKNKPTEYKLNTKVVYILIIITSVVFIRDSLSTFKLLINGYSLALIRGLAQQGSMYSNRIFNALRILIAAPFSYAFMPIFAMEFLNKNKNKGIIFSGILIIFLKIISDGSRGCLIVFGFSFFICLYFKFINIENKRIRIIQILKNNLKQLLMVFFVTIFLFIILWEVSISRSGDRLIRDTYYYFSMEPFMLDKWMQIVDESGMMGFGMASFNGLLFPLFYVVTNLLRIDYPNFWRSIYEMVESVGTEWQIITSVGTRANSYVSIFWTLYLDGRWVGVVVGMFLYGMFVGKVYKTFLKNMDKKNMAIFCIVMIGVFYSFQFIIFKNIYFTIALLMYWLIIFKKNNSLDVY